MVRIRSEEHAMTIRTLRHLALAALVGISLIAAWVLYYIPW